MAYTFYLKSNLIFWRIEKGLFLFCKACTVYINRVRNWILFETYLQCTLNMKFLRIKILSFRMWVSLSREFLNFCSQFISDPSYYAVSHHIIFISCGSPWCLSWLVLPEFFLSCKWSVRGVFYYVLIKFILDTVNLGVPEV